MTDAPKSFRFTADMLMGIDMSPPGPSVSRYGLERYQAERLAEHLQSLLDAHVAGLPVVESCQPTWSWFTDICRLTKGFAFQQTHTARLWGVEKVGE